MPTSAQSTVQAEIVQTYNQLQNIASILRIHADGKKKTRDIGSSSTGRSNSSSKFIFHRSPQRRKHRRPIGVPSRPRTGTTCRARLLLSVSIAITHGAPDRDILDQAHGIAGISREAAHIHIVSAREDKLWKLREFIVADLDGNFIRVFYDFCRGA